MTLHLGQQMTNGKRQMTNSLPMRLGRSLALPLLFWACAYDAARDRAFYREAARDLVAEYRGAPAPAAPSAGRDALAAARARGALTLDDCFAAAVDVSERIAIAGETWLQQRFSGDESFAKLFPTLEARAIEFYQEPVQLAGASGAGRVFTITDERRQVSLTLTQPLFRGLREFAAIRQKERLAEARRLDVGTALRGLYLQVADVFYGALNGEAEVRTIEDTVRLEEERRREIEARQRQGLARRTEVLLVEAQLEADRAQLTRAGNALRQLRLQLAFLLGEPCDLPLADGLSEGQALPSPAPLLEEAYQHRGDLLARDAEAQAAAEQVPVVLGEYWGSLDLIANYYAYRAGYSEFQRLTDYDLLLSYTVPLFEGGQTRARYASALSLQRQAAFARDETRRQIEVDVRSAYLDLSSADALRADLEAGLRAAEENVRLIQEEYRQGLATNLEVQTAGHLHMQARIALDRQRFTRRLAWIRLRAAQGLLPEKP